MMITLDGDGLVVAASWLQFVSAMAAVGVAIWIPIKLERQRRRDEAHELWKRQRLTWRLMSSLVATLERKHLASKGDIEGVRAALEKVDVFILPERGIGLFVELHNQLSIAAASIERNEAYAGSLAAFKFDAAELRERLEGLRHEMGVGPPPRSYFRGWRRPMADLNLGG